MLVIIDSLAASQPTVDGNKQIVSAPLYWLEANNGTAFPKCTFVVIHHNNKQGGFRGHTSIRDAVSETWSISQPTDAEMEANEWGEDTFRRRKITIGKSRSGRVGDSLIAYLLQTSRWIWRTSRQLNGLVLVEACPCTTAFTPSSATALRLANHSVEMN